jgi:hypothetical protein
MLIVNTHLERRRFVPESQKGEERPFCVWIRPDDRETSQRYMALLARVSQEDPTCPVSWIKLRAYMDGWENIEDENGPVEFERDAEGNATEETVARLPNSIRVDVLIAIEGVVSLTEADRKNSA